MIPSLLLLLGLLAPAAAGPVTFPPDGADEVGVLTCTLAACPDWIFWIGHEPGYEELPVLVPDVLLAEEVVAQPDEARAKAFAGALEAARQHVLAERPVQAATALDDAQRILADWRGTPDNQALFTLWFLRGVVTATQDRGDGSEAFQRAAATAWNRTVTAPPGLERWQDPYYAAMKTLLAGGTGTLVVDAGRRGVEYALDGVPLGGAPIRVQVFPGEHRLTAVDTITGMQWRRDVAVARGQTTTTRARFPGGADDTWVAGGLALAVDLHSLEPELADLVDAWAQRHDLDAVRFIRLDPVAASDGAGDGAEDGASPEDGDATQAEVDAEAGGILSTFVAREIRYRPKVRRFEEVVPAAAP